MLISTSHPIDVQGFNSAKLLSVFFIFILYDVIESPLESGAIQLKRIFEPTAAVVSAADILSGAENGTSSVWLDVAEP